MKFDFYRYRSKNQAFFKIHHKMTNSVIFWALHVDSKSFSKTLLFGARGRKKYFQEGESQLQRFLCNRKRPRHSLRRGRFRYIKKAIFSKKFGIGHDFIKVWGALLIFSPENKYFMLKSMPTYIYKCKQCSKHHTEVKKYKSASYVSPLQSSKSWKAKA